MQFSKAAEMFLAHCRHGRNLSPHTLRAYAVDLERFQIFAGRRTLKQCDKELIRAFIAHLFENEKLKATSIKRRIACLKAMFRWLEEEEISEDNPFRNLRIRIKQPARLPKSLTAAEIRQLIRAAAQEAGLNTIDEYGAIPYDGRPRRHNALIATLAIELMYITGMRVGELVNITLADIDIAQGVISVVGKGNRQRRVFIANEMVKQLLLHYLDIRQRLQPSTEHLLVTRYGNVVSTQHIRNALRSIVRKGRITRPITPHMLRHTAATHLLEAGVDIRFVQTLLGHQSISTTEIYTHINDTSLRQAVAGANLRRTIFV